MSEAVDDAAYASQRESRYAPDVGTPDGSAQDGTNARGGNETQARYGLDAVPLLKTAADFFLADSCLCQSYHDDDHDDHE